MVFLCKGGFGLSSRSNGLVFRYLPDIVSPCNRDGPLIGVRHPFVLPV